MTTTIVFVRTWSSQESNVRERLLGVVKASITRTNPVKGGHFVRRSVPARVRKQSVTRLPLSTEV